DTARHGDDHALAVHDLQPLLEVLDQVPRHQREPLLGADHGLQRRPLGAQLLSVALLLALGDLLEGRVQARFLSFCHCPPVCASTPISRSKALVRAARCSGAKGTKLTRRLAWSPIESRSRGTG